MGNGNVIELPVRRNDQAVRAVNVDRHIAGGQIVIDARASWPKADQRNLVCRFRNYIDEIVFVRFCLGEGWSRYTKSDGEKENCIDQKRGVVAPFRVTPVR